MKHKALPYFPLHRLTSHRLLVTSQELLLLRVLLLLMLIVCISTPIFYAPISYAQSPNIVGDESAESAATQTSPPTAQRRTFDELESGKELINMDFPELTDIKDIIKAISLWTGKNVILDRNVTGKVQIISPRPVTKIEAYEAFKSALNVLKLTPVETGKFIKIMPIRNALRDNLKTYYGSQFAPNTDQVITQIIPLKFVDAKTVRSMLSKVVSGNSLIAYEPTNTLIVSESGYKVNRVLDIIKHIDVETEQSQVAIVPIIYSDAKNIATQVKQIFTGSKSSSKASTYHSYKIFPDTKTNSVVIFGPPRTIKDVRDLVKKFDIRVEDVSRQATIHVRPLDYANAKKLAKTLNSLTGSSNTNNNNSRFSALTRLRNLSNQNSKNPSTSSEPSVADLGSGIKISADESSNSLLITGSRSAYNAVNAIIRKMDVKKSQVFIEADILSIDIGNDFSYGTSLFAGIPGKYDNFITWEAGNVSPIVTAGALKSGGDSTEVAFGQALNNAQKVLSSDFTFGILAGKGVEIPGLGTVSPGALIKMIKGDSNTRVLSSPHILISNNEVGLFSSGQKLFFRTEQPNENTGTPVSAVETEEAKLQLNIKPNISYSDYVTMQINLDADDAAGIDPNTGLPIISKRKTAQSVTVKNGQTVVISGLVNTSESETFKKIPLLGDIPLIGWLFRNSIMKKNKSNLVIFVTAHIIHGPNDLAKIYQQKLEERDEMLKHWTHDIFGNERDDAFYAALPSPDDGTFTPTQIDILEQKRLQELKNQLLKDMGYTGDIDEDTPLPAREEVITTVPIMPSESSTAAEEIIDNEEGNEPNLPLPDLQEPPQENTEEDEETSETR